MKKIGTLALIFTLFLAGQNFAVAVNSTNSPVANEVAVDGLTKKNAKKVKKQLKKKIRQQKRAERRAERAAKFMAWLAKRANGEKNALVGALICFFLGGLAIHRVFMGGSGLLILGYLFTSWRLSWTAAIDRFLPPAFGGS